MKNPVLATGGEDGMVRLWDPSSATTPGSKLVGHAGPDRAAHFECSHGSVLPPLCDAIAH
jgi:hypothetical protein